MVLKRGVNQAAFCSGVVIAPQVILTAAHCVAPVKDVRIFYRDEAGQPAFVMVQALATHPNYHPDAIAKRRVSIDLALIETQTPLGNRFSPSALDESGVIDVGEPLRIAGYGVAREGEGRTAGVLRSASLRAREPVSKILVWAEDPTGGGAGGCTGDSGGPIFSEDAAKVVAITAWSAGPTGKNCGALTQGPLVAPQRGWIEDVLKQWGLR